MNTIYLRAYATATLRLSTNGVGKFSRSVELQQHTWSKPEDGRTQLNSLKITVPDHLTLLSRNEVKNWTGRNSFDLLEANWLSVSPKVGEGSGKLIKFQQHTRKKPEDEKTQLNLHDIPLPDHLT